MGRRIVTEKQLECDAPAADKRSKTLAAAARSELDDSKAEFVPVESGAESADISTGTADASAAPDDYISKLIKYIPTEIVTLYLLVDGILKSFTSAPAVNWAVFFLLLVLTPVYMWRMTREVSKSTAWDQIVVSFFSFGLWVYVIGGPFSQLSWYVPQYGSILVAIFTVFVPLIKK